MTKDARGLMALLSRPSFYESNDGQHQQEDATDYHELQISRQILRYVCSWLLLAWVNFGINLIGSNVVFSIFWPIRFRSFIDQSDSRMFTNQAR